MNIMNSNCSIPNWNLIQQRQEQAQEEGDNHVASMLDDRMREFIWENEQPPEFSFGGIGSRRSRGGFDNNNMATTSCDDTLESIVDQAIKNGFHCHKNITTELVQNEPVSAELLVMKKRVKSSSSSFSESGDEKYPSCSIGNTKKMEYDHREEVAERSTCDTTTTMILNVKTIEEDSATCHAASENLDSENQRKEETGRSHQTRSSRAAAIHKQSERKRRDRINQKLKALQKLVPNACKTDKASMLDEVIEYMKQLKAQVNLMMNSRNAHDQMLMMMMMPSLGMQQQLQMSSLLARMATSTTSASPLPPPPPHHHQSCIPFLHPGMMISRQVPPAVAPPTIIDTPRILKGSSWRANLAAAAISNSLPYNEYYSRFLAQQSMNMELYNNMRALCTHQEADTSQRTSSHQEVNHAQRQL